MQILNNLVNKLIIDKAIKLAYIEKPLNERYDDIHLHIIFNSLNIGDYFLNIKSYLEDETFLSYCTKKEDLSVLHFVSEDGLSLYIHNDKKIFNYSEMIVLYNPEKIELSSLSFTLDNEETIKKMVSSILSLTDELHNVYQFVKERDLILALNSLSKANNHLFSFLSDYYLFNPNNHSSNDLLRIMPEEESIKYKKIISVLKIECIQECAKLLIWFVDEHIGNLPITIAKDVDIDYYLYVKRLVLQL